MGRRPNPWLIIVTLFCALMLNLLPLPAWVEWLHPDWVMLTLFFWSLTMPYSVSVGYAFVMGVLLDLCNGTVLGEHALALVIIIYIVTKLHKQLNMFPGMQQLFVVLILSTLYRFIIFLVQSAVWTPPDNILYWLAVLINVILWPWLFRLLSDLKRRTYAE